MAFPLIIEGYDGPYCANCPHLIAYYGSDHFCSLFGTVLRETSVIGKHLRSSHCVQMEQKYKEKPVTKDFGSPYDLSNDLNNIAKLARTRQKLKRKK